MKILIATGLFPPDIGGPATYSKLLFNEFPKYGVSARVLSFSEVRFLPRGICHLVYLFKLLKRGKSSDIIYAQDPVSVGLPALIASKILRKRFILKIVGDFAWEQGVVRFGVRESLDEFVHKHKKYTFFVRILKYVEIFVASRAEKIIVPSLYLKKIITLWGIAPDKISVVYNAFEKESVSEEEKNLAIKQYSFNSSDFVIISVGRLVPWKGFPILIESIKELKEEIPSIKLLIAGDGPELQRLKNLIQDLHLEETVYLLGKINHHTLFKYVNEDAKLFVLNTGYEGFPHVVLEMISAGLPVVVTDIGGNSEIISNKKALIKYNNKNALKKVIFDLYKNKDVLEEFKRGELEDIKKFSLDKMVKETIKVLSI